MRIPWKYVGLAGLAGVAATGAAVARRRSRAQREDIDPDELRARLRERLAEASEQGVNGAERAPSG